jgi:hypothetical protein
LFGHAPMVLAVPVCHDWGRPALHWGPIGDQRSPGFAVSGEYHRWWGKELFP